MSTEKTVSIIIPCYNCASYIEETLNSLAKQTFKNFDVVCVNDGSTDDTLHILDSYAAKSNLDMKIITQENGGVSKARNCGIRAADGKYISFLDSDDIYHAEFLERMITSLEQENADTAYCRLTRDFNEIYSSFSEESVCHIQQQKAAMDKLLFEMGTYGFYCYIYNRKVLLDNNLRFNESMKYFEDREFNWKYLCHCKKYVWIDLPLYGYRDNINSAMKKKTSWERTVNSLNGVRRIEEYMDNTECEYSETLKSYLYQRVMWGVAKNIALSKDKQLFDRLRKEYDVKTCMKRTAKDSNKLVKLASWMYLVHPSLFFRIVGLKK